MPPANEGIARTASQPPAGPLAAPDSSAGQATEARAPLKLTARAQPPPGAFSTQPAAEDVTSDGKENGTEVSEELPAADQELLDGIRSRLVEKSRMKSAVKRSLSDLGSTQAQNAKLREEITRLTEETKRMQQTIASAESKAQGEVAAADRRGAADRMEVEHSIA
jgi:hypothetical protein